MKCYDLTNKQYGRLRVLYRVEDRVMPSGRHAVVWHCVCECGREVDVLANSLIRNLTLSCGCMRSEMTKSRFGTHHESKTKLYGIWLSMRRRCDNERVQHYADYGGRGITVCDEWNQSYSSFRKWALSNGYREGLTLDRIDVNGNYNESNCRWVDRVVQANNRRSNKLYTYNGCTKNIKEWSDIAGIPYKKLYQRLRYGWSIERALNTK